MDISDGEVADVPQRRFRELFRLEDELVKLQDWVVATRRKVVIVFEGRDAAGKSGVITRISGSTRLPAASTRSRATRCRTRSSFPRCTETGRVSRPLTKPAGSCRSAKRVI